MADNNKENDNNIFIKITEWCKRSFLHSTSFLHPANFINPTLLKDKPSLAIFCLIFFIIFTFTSNKTLAFIKQDNQYRVNLVKTSKTNVPRSCHSLTLLNNGNVLITGNIPYVGRGKNDINVKQIEIYDLKLNKSTITGSMHLPSSDHYSILLNDGRVLILGGNKMPGSDFNTWKRIEIYNPQNNKTEIVYSEKALSVPIFLLEKGNVFISNIFDNGKHYYYIFNPTDNSFKKYLCPKNEYIKSVIKCGAETIVITFSDSRKDLKNGNPIYPTLFKIYKYNVEKNSFNFLGNIEHPFSSFLKVFPLKDNKIVIILDMFCKYTNDEIPNILTFDINTGKTEKIGKTIMNPPIINKKSSVIITHNQEILFFHKEKIEVYDINTNTSSIIKKPYFLNTYKYGSMGETMVLNDGNIITVGGYNPWEGYLKNIYVYKLIKRKDK